jgi:serine/threonine-protein kinase RsbW
MTARLTELQPGTPDRAPSGPAHGTTLTPAPAAAAGPATTGTRLHRAMDDLDELVRLEIPARPVFVGVARSVVVAVASGVEGLDADRLEDLRLAVSEACTNAIEAHQADRIDQRVVVRCRVSGTSLEVSIQDSGPGFEPQEVSPLPRLGEPGAEQLRAERGWGLQLIRALVDEVTFERSEPGTSVRLRLDLNVVV